MTDYECINCTKIFKTKWDFDRHNARKTPCNKDYLNKDHLNDTDSMSINNDYICGICNKQFNYKSHYERHLNNKYGCNKKQVISNEIVKIDDTQMIVLDDFTCKTCNKVFAYKRSLDRHQKMYCKKETDNELYLMIDQLQKELTDVKNNINISNSSLNNNSNINSNNTVNNININAYGKEDISHITNKDYKKIFDKCNSAIPMLIELIHFNDNKPENTNMYISNIKSQYAYVFNGKQWNLISKDELIDDLYDRKCIILLEKYEILKGELNEQTERNFGHFRQRYDSENMKEDVFGRIELQLYNNRTMAQKVKDVKCKS